MKRSSTQLRAKFLAVTQDRTARMVDLVAQLSEEGASDEALRQLGRELHTLKGESRLLDFQLLTSLAHLAEDLVQRYPSDRTEVPRLLGRAIDAVSLSVQGALGGATESPVEALDTEVALRKWLDERSGAAEPEMDEETGGEPFLARGPTAGALVGSGDSRGTIEAKPATRSDGVHAARMLRVSMDHLDGLSGVASDLSVGRARSRGHLSNVMSGIESLEKLLRETLERHGAQLNGAKGALEEALARLRNDARVLVEVEDSVDTSLGVLTDAVREIRLQPLAGLFASYRSFVRAAALAARKEVDFVVTGGEVAVDQRVLERVEEPLLHLLRNALTHGIEGPDERLNRGKRRVGTLRVEARQEGDRIRIVLADDGGGFDLSALARNAVRSGHIDAETAVTLTPQQAIELAFTSGLSTAEGTDQMAGRGIGLDIVRASLERAGGSIHIDSAPSRGTTCTLDVPVTLALVRAMIVEAGGNSFAVPSASIVGVRRIAVREIERVDGGECARIDGEILPLVRLREVTRIRGIRDLFVNKLGLLTLRHGEKLIGLLVDRIRGDHEIVSRALPSILGRWRLVAGVTSAEAGTPIPILRVSDLFDAATEGVRPRGPFTSGPDAGVGRRIVYAEDSFITREYVAGMLRSIGFGVVEAADGAEALAALEKSRPDLLLTDLQMPNLDGFELLRRVRANATLRGLPVVVISTLEGDQARRVAMDAGADAYLVKSQFSPESVIATLRQLLE